MDYREWKRDILRRAPRTQYPDPRPVDFEREITHTDVLFLRAMRITPYVTKAALSGPDIPC